MINTKKVNLNNKFKLKYPLARSATLPVPYSDNHPVPVYTGLADDDILLQPCQSTLCLLFEVAASVTFDTNL